MITKKPLLSLVLISLFFSFSGSAQAQQNLNNIFSNMIITPVGEVERKEGFDEEISQKEWDAVRGSSEESKFLMDLFMKERMPGQYPHLVKQRFYEIVTLSDTKYLLGTLIDPEKRKQRVFAYSLLQGLEGDDTVLLFEDYFYRTSNQDEDVRNKLFNLITRQNSKTAFDIAVRIIKSLNTQKLNDDVIFFLNYMTRFKNDDIRQTIINGTLSPLDAIRAASYIALRNYPDEEVVSIIDNALDTETAILTGESSQQLRIIDILNTTKQEIQLYMQLAEENIDAFSRALHNSALNIDPNTSKIIEQQLFNEAVNEKGGAQQKEKILFRRSRILFIVPLSKISVRAINSLTLLPNKILSLHIVLQQG